MARPHTVKLLIVVLIATILLTGCIPVAISKDHESMPTIATNTKTGDFLVAYLLDKTSGKGTQSELRITRMSADGRIQESALQPFGSAVHDALGCPAIAYSPKSDRFFVAIPERDKTGTYDHVIGRYLDGKGYPLPIPEILLFDDPKYAYYGGPSPDSNGYGVLHVVYNSIQNKFVVTVQMAVNGNNGVYAQPVPISAQAPKSPVVQIDDFGKSGFPSHAIAYAPINNQTSPGGRYFFVANQHMYLLDAQLNRIKVTATDANNPTLKTSDYIPISLGVVDKGKERHFDVAYGEVDGKQCFLLVWQDPDDFTPPGYPDTEKWTNVWGTYIDATREYYTDFTPHSEENTPFPISWIFEHKTGFPQPRVTYSPSAKAFFVVWREVPTDHPLNDAKLSHIRGAWIDYFVPDGIAGTSLVPNPHDNVVLSEVKGSCQTAHPFLCLSDAEPDFPAVASLSGKTAAVVWEQNGVVFSDSGDIMGEFLTIP